MNETEQQYGRVFDGSRAFYQQDWHAYYPAIIKLVTLGTSVLEIGCGRGGLLQYLRDQKDCTVRGLDISDDAVEISRQKGIEVQRLDVERDEVPGTYDAIILSGVLEHMMDPLFVLRKLRGNLNERGGIIIGVPNFSDIWSLLSYLRGKTPQRWGNDPEDRKLGIQPAGHIRFFNQASLEHILTKTGYESVEWSYHRPTPSRSSSTSLARRLFRWSARRLLAMDRPLFASFIAVRARALHG